MAERHAEDLRSYLLLGAFALLCAAALLAWWTNARRLPENVGRALSAQEQAEVLERNSPLARYAHLSPNATFPRQARIDKITIHHMAGDISLERLGEVFADPARRASSNYAIDVEGNVALYVEERDRAWTSSSPENDHRAVTIEVANDERGGDWHVSDASYAALIELCVDICRRNGMEALVWTGDASGSLTIHSFFRQDTECPGPYLTEKMPEIAAEVTRRLQAAST